MQAGIFTAAPTERIEVRQPWPTATSALSFYLLARRRTAPACSADSADVEEPVMAYAFLSSIILPEEAVRDAPPSDDEPLSEQQLRTIVLLLQGERYPRVSAILGVTLDEV